MIDALARAPHYVDHLAAVFLALPPESRGGFMVAGTGGPERVHALGLTPTRVVASDKPVLVASWGDLLTAQRLGRKRIAIMEHGAGQSYGGRPTSAKRGSYAGGQNRGAASLFLHPGEHPAARDRKAYPKARVEVVGSPHLDMLPAREGAGSRVVAVSFHANLSIAPEAKNAVAWAFPAITALRERFRLIGHAHPREWDRMSRLYRRAGIEPVKDFREVVRRADVYVCDNSSTLFAFATRGPVVVLNPPWYDRKVKHGLRFWDAASVGVNCDDPATLGDRIEEALADPPEQQARREAALDLVYAYREGAAQRAADVLMDWVRDG